MSYLKTNKDSILFLEPEIGLGFFKFGTPINKILTEIKDRAEYFEKVDIVIGDSQNDPIYLVLTREGIKLRFDPFSQLLELIEIEYNKDFPSRFFTLHYKNEIIIDKEKPNLSSDFNLTYNKINEIFGPSKLPSLVKENKFAVLKYDGISFIFSNQSQENEEFIKLQNLKLVKIALFADKSLKDSLRLDPGLTQSLINKIFANNPHSFPQHFFNMKIDFDKGIIISNPLKHEFSNINSNVKSNNINNINYPNAESSRDVINNNKNNINNINQGLQGNWYSTEEEIIKNNDIVYNNNQNANNLINNYSPNENIEHSNSTNLNNISSENELYEIENTYNSLNDSYNYSVGINPNASFNQIDSKSPIIINIGDSYNSILYKLKNPNYIFFNSKSQEISEYSEMAFNPGITDENDDMYLNYYSLGIDFLIDGKNLKLKKIKLHSNNPISTEFGIWNRASFNLEFNKSLIRRLNETSYDGNSSRKISEDYNILNNISNKNSIANVSNNTPANINNNNINHHEDSSNINNNNNQLRFSSNFNTNSNLAAENKSDFQANDYCINNTNNNTINAINNNYNNNYKLDQRRRRDYKYSFENDKSFNSINESYISVSSNISDNIFSLNITPNTPFSELLSKVNKNSYVIYHRCDQKINMTIKYYCFDGLIFEVLENNTINTITIFKACNPLP